MTPTLGLFEAFGIELEYMIVGRESLGVRPLSDQILYSIAGAYEPEVELGELAWSNELVLHVIELKTNGPTPDLAGLSNLFHRDTLRINKILEPLAACLMPTGMHPWMDPESDAHLWPHEYSRVYESFDRIFNCRGHGWSNLQSMHVNLPFKTDDDFGRLHAAIRMVLPILPALAASSPFADGTVTGIMDTRLAFYRRNCLRVPAVTGRVIPERVFTEDEYHTRLLEPMYRDIAALDPDGILRHEWLNARGAIARFDRRAIEIRLLDMQECPRADMVISVAVVGVVRALVEERWVSYRDQKRWGEEQLGLILDATIRDGDMAQITDLGYLRDMGVPAAETMLAGNVWKDLMARSLPPSAGADAQILDLILGEGPLSRRLLRGWDGTRASLSEIYETLCSCLRNNSPYTADASLSSADL